MMRETLSASIRAITIIVIAFVGIISRKGIHGIQLKRKAILTSIILVGCIIISCLFNGFDLVFDLWMVLMLLIATVICSNVSERVFWAAYVDVMVALGLISAIIFTLYQIVPSLFAFFPNHIWHGDILMKNCYVCVVQVNAQFKRNFGIFYEPGMFSVFLILALYYSLFKVKADVKKIAALLLALATTLSTNGYLCASGLVFAYLLNSHKIDGKTKRKMVFLILVTALAITVFLLNSPGTFNFLTSKLLEFDINTSISRSDSGSGYERWRSIVYACKSFASSPIVGVGYTGWQNIFRNIIATATPINWFGLYGIIFGSIINFLYLRTAIVSANNCLVNIIIAFVLLANIISQNMVSDLTILTILLYQANNITTKPLTLRGVISR